MKLHSLDLFYLEIRANRQRKHGQLHLSSPGHEMVNAGIPWCPVWIVEPSLHLTSGPSPQSTDGS